MHTDVRSTTNTKPHAAQNQTSKAVAIDEAEVVGAVESLRVMTVPLLRRQELVWFGGSRTKRGSFSCVYQVVDIREMQNRRFMLTGIRYCRVKINGCE